MEEREGIEEPKAVVPLWLLFVYITLLTWSVWNVFKYLD
jgi:hypothetical protein